MKRLLLFLFLFISLIGIAQNAQLAQSYFEKGEFEKALLTYQELLTKQPSNYTYISKTVECYQQMQNFLDAEKMLTQKITQTKLPQLYVDLGYNFKLQKKDKEADKQFELALTQLEKNPNTAYTIAQSFDKKGLYDYALKTYEKAQKIEPKMNFNYQIGVLYGQLGRTEEMIQRFLDESYANPTLLSVIQNTFSRFINDNPDENFISLLRKTLIQRAQKDQDIFWNQYLSWFYINQKDYAKAFVQEKAIYKRMPENFHNIVNLAELTMQDNDEETAMEIITFVLENTDDNGLQIYCNNVIIEHTIKKNDPATFSAIQSELEMLIKKYGQNPSALPLHRTLGKFVAFNLEQPHKGRSILQQALTMRLNDFEQAEIKMDMADIFLYDAKFNQASILYAQIEENLKNNAIAHEATLRGAKASYFKGDFEWALKQFKVLKSATSQLIANDALEYFLLINDNKVADSTMSALTKFARADYLLYKKKIKEAIQLWNEILTEYPDNEIGAATLNKLGFTHQSIGKETEALAYYQTLIEKFPESIYIDEAYFFSGEIYWNSFQNKEQAKKMFEKIIFDHQDSIYYIEAQKNYRQLRGDFDS